MEKVHYTYQQAENDCRVLAKKLSRYNFDWIVTIARGGLVPACILSQLLDIKKIRVVPIQHYKGTKREKAGPKILADFIPPVKSKILLIDDVVDTSKTMKMALEILKEWGNKVITASLHFKPKQSIDFKPDFWANETEAWIVYPWELRKE